MRRWAVSNVTPSMLSTSRKGAPAAQAWGEQAAGYRVPSQVFRMPLHRDDPILSRRLDGLGQAVGRGARDREARCHGLDRLVMPAVDADLGSRRELGETRLGRDRDRVVEARLLLARAGVDHIRRPLRRDVLDERAPERHVDDLQPAADSEHRSAGAAGLLEEGEVDPVSLGIHFDGAVVEERTAVAGGVHVDAAAEQKRVEGLRGRGERRDDLDRLARHSGLHQASKVVVGLGEVGVPVERQGDAHRLYCRGHLRLVLRDARRGPPSPCRRRRTAWRCPASRPAAAFRGAASS